MGYVWLDKYVACNIPSIQVNIGILQLPIVKTIGGSLGDVGEATEGL